MVVRKTKIFIASLVLIFAILTSAKKGVSKFNQNSVNKVQVSTGHLDNCGDKRNKLQASWTPSPIMYKKMLDVKFSMTPLYDLSMGSAWVQVNVSGIPDPIYENSMDFMCEKLTNYDKNLTCPIKKGKAYNLQAQRTFLPPIQIPEGEYIIRATVKNEDGQQVICVSGKISVKYEDDYGGYDNYYYNF